MKDLVDAIAKVGGILTVAFAGWGLYRSASAREEDIRWRKAMAAREFFADIHRHPYAVEAIHMMDCHISNYLYTASNAEPDCKDVNMERICRAIESKGQSGEGDKYIYRCFDWFIYYLDRIVYLSDAKLLEGSDVRPQLRPYTIVLRENRCFRKLIKEHHYDFADSFIYGRDSTYGKPHTADEQNAVS